MPTVDLSTFVNISNTQYVDGALVPITPGTQMYFTFPGVQIVAATPMAIDMTIANDPNFTEVHGIVTPDAAGWAASPQYLDYDDDQTNYPPFNDTHYVLKPRPGWNQFNTAISSVKTYVAFRVNPGAANPSITSIVTTYGANSAIGSMVLSGTTPNPGPVPAVMTGSMSLSGILPVLVPISIRSYTSFSPGSAGSSAGFGAPASQIGDRVILFHQGKVDPTRTPITPLATKELYNGSGPLPYPTQVFTLLASIQGGAGSFGADTGPTFTHVYGLDVTIAGLDGASMASGFPNYADNDTYSIYVIAPSYGYQHQFLLTDPNWVRTAIDSTTAADLSNNVTWGVQPTTGDLILASGVQPTDFGAAGAHFVNGSGMTGGSTTSRVSQVTTVGNDAGVVGVTREGWTGTVPGITSVAFNTGGASHSGTLGMLLFRQGPGAPRGGSGSLTLSGGMGAVGIAAITPSGSMALGAAQTDAVAVVPPPPPQRAGGRYRKGTGRLLWEPYVAVPVRPPGVHVYDLVSTFSVPTFPDAFTQPVYDVNYAYKIRDRDRIVIGNKDVTEWRGAATPAPSYQLIIPMKYGPGVIEIPQVNAVFERPGHGALRFMRPGAKVMLQRVNAADVVVATDYIGFVVGYRTDGADLAIELGGELSGRAALVDKQVPIFRSRHDAGEMLWEDCRDAGITMKPRLGNETGVRLWKFGGGMSVADHINQVCALATKRSNEMYTVMPDSNGVYRVTAKDKTTIHGTIYFDDTRVKPSLTRDIAEEPNRIFVAATAPNGRRIRFATYPGLIQGPAPDYPVVTGNDWHTFDLANAEFHEYEGDTYGQYADGVIKSNGPFDPGFYFPGFVVDSGTSYDLEVRRTVIGDGFLRIARKLDNSNTQWSGTANYIVGTNEFGTALDHQQVIGPGIANWNLASAEVPTWDRISFDTGAGDEIDRIRYREQGGGTPASFGPGTTDEDTVNGDGITIMINRLVVTGFLNFGNDTYPGGYDDDVVDAIEDLQEKAGLNVTGLMNVKTWNALFDLSATGYHLNWSKILPAAEDTRVRRWLRTSSGSIRKANPAFQRNRLKVDASIEMGNGFWEYQAKNFARKELQITGDNGNWVGEVSTKCSVVWGTHVPGDPVTDADVMIPRDVIPGMNLWAPLWDGGTLFHVAGNTISEQGDRGSFMLDTQFRDTLKVWQIIERNRESRHDPARTWLQQHRRSQLVPDALGPWDDIGGTIERVDLPAGEWVVFPIVAGQEGTIARLRMHTDNDAAEYVVAIFGKRIYPNKLKNKIGNPMGTGADKWKNEKIRRDLDKSNVLLYVAGDDEDPCGYYPRTKSEGGTRTGKWFDDAGIQYHTFRHPVLWVAVYADRDCHLRAGRIAWPQLEGGV